jgi:AcrR family transcriptional regulator
MARLTRVESQARTRERLIDTATTAFLRDGYAATSLERVADEAGFSKGAVYSNFRSKEQLCGAVLDAVHTKRLGRITSAVASADTLDQRLTAVQEWAESTIGDENWTALEVEFAAHTRHDGTLRTQLAERGKAIQCVIASVLADTAHESGATLPMPAEDLAGALLSLGIGLGVRRAIDPRIPVRVLTDTVRVLAGQPVANV